jgi:ATP phosphoribosyltransferase
MGYKLKVAIQKSGRLYEDSLKLLKECGINIQLRKNQLKAFALNFPLEIFLIRDDDIPQYLEDSIADIGIVGDNIFSEKRKRIQVKERLGFGKCRLSIAIPRQLNYRGIKDLNGKRITTSYPILVQEFLTKHSLDAEIHEISGSVELTPSIGLSDCICDLVSSGSTLFMNGLKEVETLLQSEAILASSRSIEEDPIGKKLMKELLFRIRAVRNAKNNKYILFNAPRNRKDQIRNCLMSYFPDGLTISPINYQLCVIHAVINEKDFWRVAENLKIFGVFNILVMPIEKIISSF